MSDVSRRSFLGSAGAISACAPAPAGRSGPAPAAVKTISLGRSTLPVLRRADVVVAGGSFAGVAAALQWARAGRKVLLIEPRTYLGREVTATLRPWVARRDPLPAAVQACTGAKNPPQYPNPAKIANEFTEATGDLYLQSLIEVGLELFALTMLINALARLLIAATARKGSAH